MSKASCGTPLSWHGLYSGQTALLTPDSVSHPAKMAPALVFRIFDHLAELGLLKPEDTVLDPMAGTGLTGLAWAAKGGRSVLVELEPRFVGFIGDNKERLARTLGREVEIEVLQGDTRHLSELLGERGLKAVTSPPYQTATGEGKSLTPLATGGETVRGRGFTSHGPTYASDMGTTPGQIGALPDKPLKAVTSPPYGDQNNESRIMSERKDGMAQRLAHDRPLSVDKTGAGKTTATYGTSPSNIGNLPDKPLKAVTSPPYEDSDNRNVESALFTSDGKRRFNEGWQDGYGTTEGQIGQERQEDYLSAMRQVYSEIAKVADVLVVVTKNPTRAGKLRRLDLNTIALLESTGWEVRCQHRAILFEEQEQGDLFGGSKKQTRGRLSFFKRLSYQKGNAVARWEDVIVCTRRLAAVSLGGLE